MLNVKLFTAAHHYNCKTQDKLPNLLKSTILGKGLINFDNRIKTYFFSAEYFG